MFCNAVLIDLALLNGYDVQ